ncbi:hypothetical protein V6N13_028991 [Hibiscus sabdariffa]|uniref:Uncharacterized protein n=1 Tax=Hibiscus sabdariffa TaxID=183260 RepID=A0ABR2NX23_9ROSI
MTLPPVNPNDANDNRPSPYESPGGRPPEGIFMVSVPISLERPNSPTATEVQRNPKKGHNSADGMFVDSRETIHSQERSDMMGIEHSRTEENLDTCESDELGVNAGQVETKISYSSMVAKSQLGGEGVNAGLRGVNEEIVVSDEDVSIDHSGSYPVIQFSKKVHE